MSRWQQRARPTSGTPGLSQVQAAVENLADLMGIHPDSKARVAFQAITDVALLGTVVISGALATVHLYRSLFRKHKEDKPTLEAAPGDGAPPRRHDPHAIALADGRDGPERKAPRGR
jgi:hypothetical protein